MTFISSRGPYPVTRLRRLRQSEWSRKLVAETALSVNDLIWPLFVLSGSGERQSVDSLPGVFRLSVDLLLAEVARAISFVRSVMRRVRRVYSTNSRRWPTRSQRWSISRTIRARLPRKHAATTQCASVRSGSVGKSARHSRDLSQAAMRHLAEGVHVRGLRPSAV